MRGEVLAVEEVVVRQEHEAVHGLRRGLRVELDDDGAARGLHGGDVGLGRVDLHGRRTGELRLGLARALRRLRAARDRGRRRLRVDRAGLRSRLALRRGARARCRAGAHARRRARLRGAAAVEEQEPRRHQHDHTGHAADDPEGPLPAAPLRVSLRLPSGRELRQVSISGTFGHPSDEPIRCPTIRRRGRRGCRSRRRARVRSRTGASRRRITPPATITSPRPGAMIGSGGALRRRHPARSSRTRSTSDARARSGGSPRGRRRRARARSPGPSSRSRPRP